METKITPEFLQAFAKFQELCPTIEKSASGHNYKYASLPQIVERIRPFLNEAGLILFQEVTGNQELQLTTHLYAVKGGGVKSVFIVPLSMGQGKMNAMQTIGSNVSYMRRYALSAILNLVTDEDKDASDTEKFKTTDEIEANKPFFNSVPRIVKYAQDNDLTVDDAVKKIRETHKVNETTIEKARKELGE